MSVHFVILDCESPKYFNTVMNEPAELLESGAVSQAFNKQLELKFKRNDVFYGYGVWEFYFYKYFINTTK